MTAGAKYGAFSLGILISVLYWLNSPIAWAAFWASEAILLTIYTKLTWQRTRLIWMTAGGADAALVAATFVLASLKGYTFRNLPPSWWTVFLINTAALGILHFLCRTIYREQFRRWQQHMESMSLRDMLMFRHIPHLR